MNFDYIFILTYGRSGSTLLQSILNSVPGIMIRGENSAALRGVIGSWYAASTAKEQFSDGSHESANPWYGAKDMDLEGYGRDIAASFIRNILKTPSSIRVTGFKEIRYHVAADELEAEMAFMRRFFRRSAFLINTRNLDATIASNKKAGHAVTEEELASADQLLRDVAASPTDDVFHVHYDDYAGKPENLEPMFRFLGFPFGVEQVGRVMRVKHSTFEDQLDSGLGRFKPPISETGHLAWPGVE